MKRQLCFLLTAGCLLATSIAYAGQQSPQTTLPTPPPQVTTHIKATTLQDALKEVSRLIGVPLSASADTADLKVTILIKDLPLDILRSRLAETLHLTWIRHEADKEQPVSYLIYRSAQNKEEELELRTRGERAFRNGIAEAIRALSLAPEARAKLFSEHPALAATFAQPGGEAAVTLLAQLSPQLRESIMDGNQLEFPSSKPPPELASHFGAIMKKLTAANSDNPDSIFAQLLRQEGKFSVTRTGEGAGSQIGIAFRVQTETLSGSLGYGVKGVHAGEVYLGAYFPDHTGADYVAAHRPVPIPTKLTAKSLDDLMEKVADTLHINIIGESYRESLDKNEKGEVVYPLSVEAGSSTIAQALDNIVWKDYWWKHGSVYLFQRPLWWVDRRGEVTDTTLASLTKLFKSRPLSFEAMAEVGKTLSAEQWNVLALIPNGNDAFLAQGQAAMRFYGHLTDFRKADLFLQDGTDASILSSADEMRLRSWIAATGNEALQEIRNTPGKIQVMAKHLPKNAKQDRVLFRAVFQATDGTTRLLREQIVTDGYVDPTDPQLHAQN